MPSTPGSVRLECTHTELRARKRHAAHHYTAPCPSTTYDSHERVVAFRSGGRHDTLGNVGRFGNRHVILRRRARTTQPCVCAHARAMGGSCSRRRAARTRIVAGAAETAGVPVPLLLDGIARGVVSETVLENNADVSRALADRALDVFVR